MQNLNMNYVQNNDCVLFTLTPLVSVLLFLPLDQKAFLERRTGQNQTVIISLQFALNRGEGGGQAQFVSLLDQCV